FPTRRSSDLAGYGAALSHRSAECREWRRERYAGRDHPSAADSSPQQSMDAARSGDGGGAAGLATADRAGGGRYLRHDRTGRAWIVLLDRAWQLDAFAQP